MNHLALNLNIFITNLARCAFFLLASILFSCNGVFYQPDDEVYATPSKLGLEYESFELIIDAKTKLQGWKIAPKQIRPSPAVAVIQFHGNAENRTSHFTSVAWLADLGVDVVVFDYRGYDGSTNKPTRKGLIEDGINILKWFEDEFPNSKRFVIGQSLGAAVAVPSLVKSGVKVDGLILDSGFHSYRGVAKEKLSSIWLTWILQWMPWVLLSGDEDPVDFAKDVKVPILAFHDKNDRVVPVESGKILYDAFPKDTTRIIIQDGNRHTAGFHSDRKESVAMTLQFLGIHTSK